MGEGESLGVRVWGRKLGGQSLGRRAWGCELERERETTASRALTCLPQCFFLLLPLDAPEPKICHAWAFPLPPAYANKVERATYKDRTDQSVSSPKTKNMTVHAATKRRKNPLPPCAGFSKFEKNEKIHTMPDRYRNKYQDFFFYQIITI